MSTVPQELTIDILLHLPIKSLCRFKCVSKSWLTLITHPLFVKMHLSRSRKQKLLFSHASLYVFDLETSLNNEVHPNLDQLNDIKPNTQYFDSIFGSCNGLFYIKFRYADIFFFIYNPSTKEYSKKILDVLPINEESNSFYFSSFMGFGYAESIDDYKFVRVIHDENTLHNFSLKETIHGKLLRAIFLLGNLTLSTESL